MSQGISNASGSFGIEQHQNTAHWVAGCQEISSLRCHSAFTHHSLIIRSSSCHLIHLEGQEKSNRVLEREEGECAFAAALLSLPDADGLESVESLLGRFEEATEGSSPTDEGDGCADGAELAADVAPVISVSWPLRRESISIVAPTYSSSTWQEGEGETQM